MTGLLRRMLRQCGRRIVHRYAAAFAPVEQPRLPNLAPQMRMAFASMASNTGSSSPGELLMTLQDFGGRRLLLQGLGEFPRALLLRLEQPHVLDGDGRLVGEGGDKLDLLLGERPYALSHQDHHAHRTPSRIIGTPTSVRKRAGSATWIVYSGSASISSI